MQLLFQKKKKKELTYKNTTVSSLSHKMQSYTNQADLLYREAEEIDFNPESFPFFEPIMQQQLIYNEAREMENAARGIRRQFQEIASSGKPAPSYTMMRKGVVSVKNGSSMFSVDQLTKVVDATLGVTPNVIFRPKSKTKNYVVVLFWATHAEEVNCQAQKKIEVVKREIAVDGYELRFLVESILQRQIYYLVNNYECLRVQTDGANHLSTDSLQELTNVQEMIGKAKLSGKK